MRRLSTAGRIGVVLAALILAGCSSGPAASAPASAGIPSQPSDPAAAVAAALTDLSGGPITSISESSCAGRGIRSVSVLAGANLANLGALVGPINGADLLPAMTIAFAHVTSTAVSRTESAAKVHVGADVTVDVDQARLIGILRTIANDQGISVDDASLAAQVARMATGVAEPQKLDQVLDLVKEGGRWLLCPDESAP